VPVRVDGEPAAASDAGKNNNASNAIAGKIQNNNANVAINSNHSNVNTDGTMRFIIPAKSEGDARMCLTVMQRKGSGSCILKANEIVAPPAPAAKQTLTAYPDSRRPSLYDSQGFALPGKEESPFYYHNLARPATIFITDLIPDERSDTKANGSTDVIADVNHLIPAERSDAETITKANTNHIADVIPATGGARAPDINCRDTNIVTNAGADDDNSDRVDRSNRLDNAASAVDGDQVGPALDAWGTLLQDPSDDTGKRSPDEKDSNTQDTVTVTPEEIAAVNRSIIERQIYSRSNQTNAESRHGEASAGKIHGSDSADSGSNNDWNHTDRLLSPKTNDVNDIRETQTKNPKMEVEAQEETDRPATEPLNAWNDFLNPSIQTIILRWRFIATDIQPPGCRPLKRATKGQIIEKVIGILEEGTRKVVADQHSWCEEVVAERDRLVNALRGAAGTLVLRKVQRQTLEFTIEINSRPQHSAEDQVLRLLQSAEAVTKRSPGPCI
jgi:hypothetical protein